MTEFLLFCIATVGMTSIVTQGVIFQPFREFVGNWAERIRERREQKANEQQAVNVRGKKHSLVEWCNELINCAQCTGFWSGLFCGLILITPVCFSLNSTGNTCDISLWTQCKICLLNLLQWNCLFMLFCCGLGGSFLASLGCNLIDWVFYNKMNALRQLEEHDLTLAERRANLEAREK